MKYLTIAITFLLSIVNCISSEADFAVAVESARAFAASVPVTYLSKIFDGRQIRSKVLVYDLFDTRWLEFNLDGEIHRLPINQELKSNLTISADRLNALEANGKIQIFNQVEKNEFSTNVVSGHIIRQDKEKALIIVISKITTNYPLNEKKTEVYPIVLLDQLETAALIKLL